MSQKPAHHTLLQTVGNLHRRDKVTEWWTITNEQRFYEIRWHIPYNALFCHDGPGGLVVYLDMPNNETNDATRMHKALQLIANQSWADEEEKAQAAEFMRQVARDIVRKRKPSEVGGMDPDCYYAKSCGFDPETCPVCKDRRKSPADGIYYGDEIGGDPQETYEADNGVSDSAPFIDEEETAA